MTVHLSWEHRYPEQNLSSVDKKDGENATTPQTEGVCSLFLQGDAGMGFGLLCLPQSLSFNNTAQNRRYSLDLLMHSLNHSLILYLINLINIY